MPEEQTQYKLVKSSSDVLVHKKVSASSYSSGTSENNFFVPEVEFISVSCHDSGVDSLKNCEHQPLLGRMQSDTTLNTFPGELTRTILLNRTQNEVNNIRGYFQMILNSRILLDKQKSPSITAYTPKEYIKVLAEVTL